MATVDERGQLDLVGQGVPEQLAGLHLALTAARDLLAQADARAALYERELGRIRQSAVAGLPHPLDTDLGAQLLYAALPGLPVEPAVGPDREWTPLRRTDSGSTVVTVKRCCNGCGAQLGDVTESEMDAATTGRPLPDVRQECPTCAPGVAAGRPRRHPGNGEEAAGAS